MIINIVWDLHVRAPVNLMCSIRSARCRVRVQSLDLSWNEVRGEGAAAVAELVRENNFLKRLVLASNGLSDDGAAALGRSLAANAGLRELDLSSNRIGLRGAAPIAKALQQNEALDTLRVRTSLNHCHCFALIALSGRAIHVSPQWPPLPRTVLFLSLLCIAIVLCFSRGDIFSSFIQNTSTSVGYYSQVIPGLCTRVQLILFLID